MKVINTKRTIDRILEEYSEDLYDPFEDEFKAPCWEIKLEDNRIYFLIDFKEILSHSYDKELTLDDVNKYMSLFKSKRIDELKKELNGN